MSKAVKSLIIGVYGISCKLAFHVIAFILAYKYNITWFYVLLAIFATHQIVTYLCLRGLTIKSEIVEN